MPDRSKMTGGTVRWCMDRVLEAEHAAIFIKDSNAKKAIEDLVKVVKRLLE